MWDDHLICPNIPGMFFAHISRHFHCWKYNRKLGYLNRVSSSCSQVKIWKLKIRTNSGFFTWLHVVSADGFLSWLGALRWRGPARWKEQGNGRDSIQVSQFGIIFLKLKMAWNVGKKQVLLIFSFALTEAYKFRTIWQCFYNMLDQFLWHIYWNNTDFLR